MTSFVNLRRLLQDISLPTKGQVYQAAVKPVLLYDYKI